MVVIDDVLIEVRVWRAVDLGLVLGTYLDSLEPADEAPVHFVFVF